MQKLVVCVLFLASVFGKELSISLPTKSRLLPVLIEEVKGASLTDEYKRELLEALQFDFAVNAYTFVLDPKTLKKIHLSQMGDAFINFQSPKMQPYFTIQLNVEDEHLHVTFFNKEKTLVKHIRDIPLSLDAEKDRVVCHHIHDKIVKALLNIEGIASKKILFCKRNAKQNFQVIYSDYDAKNQRIVTDENENCLCPKFISSEGKSTQFLVVNYRSGQPKIHLGSLHSLEQKRLVKLAGQQLLPAISLQNNALAFISDRTTNIDLFVQFIDLKNKKASRPKQLFSYPNSTQSSPTFSPDGKQIVFVSDKTSRPHLYLMPTYIKKQITPLKITNKNEENTCPAWSFDGKRIAYVAKIDGVRQIWILEIKTQEEWQLTFDKKNKENPCFAPDNLHLIYNAQEDEDSNLYLIDLHQKKPVRITHGKQQKRFACFEM
ncbi:MAG: Protein TolB [Chlamydiae bacterium]|nr:Protein TolB [Chlamydiota bacterium]